MPKSSQSNQHPDSTPRLPLVDLGSLEPGSELEQMLSSALSHDGQPLNIFAVLAHHPKLLKRFNLFGGFLLNKGLVPDREREIVILRVGSNAGSVYEFGQHTIIGAEAGLSEAEIAGYLATGDWQGKAGGYAIQGPAAAFVAWMEGSFSAVVGLPLHETANLLQAAGMEVWR